MTSINYNEFQAGQGVSAPALNENFSLTNNAIESLEANLASSVTSLSSSVNLKANKNGSSAEVFNVAAATENTQAVNLGQLNSAIAPLTPTGSVIWFAGTTLPSGYLLCDGSAVSRTTYADLFEIIGVTFGVGDSSSTFNLPKLTDNRFIEGAGVAGQQHSAGLPNITGSFKANCLTEGGLATSGALYNAGASGLGSYHADSTSNIIGLDASRANSIYGSSSTVQPKSLTLLPCIKY